MTKIELLEQIKQNRFEDEECVRKLSASLYKEAERTEDQHSMGLALYYQGEATYEINELESALLLKKSLEYLVEEKEPELYANANNILGIIYGHNEEYSVAVDYHTICIDICLLYQKYHIAGLSSANIAFLFQSIRSYEMAISYYEKAIEYFELVGDSQKYESHIPTLQTNIFVCYALSEKKEKMQELLEKLIEKKELIEPAFTIPMYEAWYLQMKGDRDKMLEKLKEVVALALQEAYQADYIDNYQILCRLLYEGKYYEEAKQIIDRIDLSSVSDTFFPRIMIEMEKYKMAFYEYKGDFHGYIESSKRYIYLYEMITAGYFKTVDESLHLNLYVKELSDKEKKYREEADTDQLTQINNRMGLEKCAEIMIQEALEKGKSLATYIVDVDYFKQYNDRYGHLSGDECLKKVAEIINQKWTEQYCAARFGGDEFVLLCYDMNLENAQKTADAIIEGVRQLQMESKDSPISENVSVSIGMCVKIPEKQETLRDLIDRADAGLYEAKQQGRNQWKIHS